MQESQIAYALLISEPRIRRRVGTHLLKSLKKVLSINTLYPTKSTFKIACEDISKNGFDEIVIIYKLDFLEFGNEDSLTVDEFVETTKSKFLISHMYIYKKDDLFAVPIYKYSDQHHKVYSFDMAKGNFDNQGLPALF